MTETEAFQEIISRPSKHSEGTMEQSHYSHTVSSFKRGSIKRETIWSFIKRFGYVKRGQEWVKTENK